MISELTGYQIGPRQFELPPKRELEDSAGSYATRYSSPWRDSWYGCDSCHFESDRIPYEPRKWSSSSIRASTRRSFSSVKTDSRYRFLSPGLSERWMLAASSGERS